MTDRRHRPVVILGLHFASLYLERDGALERTAGPVELPERLPLLEDLSAVMRDASICGLGQAAPNPIDCVVKYFPEELK